MTRIAKDTKYTSLRDTARTNMQNVDDHLTGMSSRSCLGTNFFGGTGVLPAAVSALACSSAFLAAAALWTFLKSSLRFAEEHSCEYDISDARHILVLWFKTITLTQIAQTRPTASRVNPDVSGI
jgi:hypothetical protein